MIAQELEGAIKRTRRQEPNLPDAAFLRFGFLGAGSVEGAAVFFQALDQLGGFFGSVAYAAGPD
jgi:hypothetical protein